MKDRIQAILELKQRDPRRHIFGSFALWLLQQDWQKRRDSEGCTPDFYVIRAVTLLEVFTRVNLAELIDDKRFTAKAVDFARNLKIDFGLVREIQDRTITLGDMLAHSVPVNSFGQIISHFDTLLGKAVRPLLEAAVDRWDTEITKKATGPIITDFPSLATCLTRLFEVRHILCHENPRRPPYDKQEIDNFIKNAFDFTNALEEVLTSERFGLVPLTQTDMNIAAGQKWQEADDVLKQRYSEIDKRVVAYDAAVAGIEISGANKSWSQALKEAQEDWERFRDSHCEFDTYVNRGGTIRPLLRASEATRLTEERIAYYESWIEKDNEK